MKKTTCAFIRGFAGFFLQWKLAYTGLIDVKCPKSQYKIGTEM